MTYLNGTTDLADEPDGPERGNPSRGIANAVLISVGLGLIVFWVLKSCVF